MKNIGKKAIGFVRGLNGDKLASFISNTAPIPYIRYAEPFLRKLGQFINDKLDDISKDNEEKLVGGIRKPKKKPRRPEVVRYNTQEFDN